MRAAPCSDKQPACRRSAKGKAQGQAELHGRIGEVPGELDG